MYSRSIVPHAVKPWIKLTPRPRSSDHFICGFAMRRNVTANWLPFLASYSCLSCLHASRPLLLLRLHDAQNLSLTARHMKMPQVLRYGQCLVTRLFDRCGMERASVCHCQARTHVPQLGDTSHSNPQLCIESVRCPHVSTKGNSAIAPNKTSPGFHHICNACVGFRGYLNVAPPPCSCVCADADLGFLQCLSCIGLPLCVGQTWPRLLERLRGGIHDTYYWPCDKRAVQGFHRVADGVRCRVSSTQPCTTPCHPMS